MKLTYSPLDPAEPAATPTAEPTPAAPVTPTAPALTLAPSEGAAIGASPFTPTPEDLKTPQFSVLGTPAPDSFAARTKARMHPLSQKVLENFDLTQDLNANKMAIINTLAKADPYYELNRASLEQLDEAQLKNLVEQPKVSSILKVDSVVRKNLARNAEAAAILRGDIPLVLAAEGAFATYQRLSGKDQATVVEEAFGITPQTRPLSEGIKNAVNRGTESLAAARELVAAAAYFNLARESSIGAAPPAGSFFPDPLQEEARDARVMGGLTRSLRAPTRLENPLLGTEKGLKALENVYRSMLTMQSMPHSTRASEFLQQAKALETQHKDWYDQFTGFLSLATSDPIGAVFAISEVMAENAPIMAVSAATGLTVGAPAAIATSSALNFLREYGAYNPDSIAYVKKKTGVDLATEEGRREYAINPEVRKAQQEWGILRGLPIAASQFAGLGIQRAILLGSGGKVSKGLKLFGSEIITEGGGEAVAGAAVGQFSVIESMLEATAGGHPTNLFLEGVTAAGSDISRRLEVKRTENWLKGMEGVKGAIAGIPAEKLTTAAEVLAEKFAEDGTENFYIRAEELVRFDQDGSIAATLGLAPEDVQRAADEAGDVVVDVPTFVRHILGKDGFDALLRHSTTSEGGLTPAEAEAWAADPEAQRGIAEQAQAFAEKVQGRLFPSIGAKDIEKLAVDMDTIAKEVSRQLEATGVYDSRQSAMFGQLTAQRYVTRAVRMTEETGQPVDAMALYIADNLRIAGEAEQVAAAFEQSRLRSLWDRIRGRDRGDVVTLRHGGTALEGGKFDVSRASPDARRSVLGRGIYFASDKEGVRAQIHRTRLREAGRLYEVQLDATAMGGLIEALTTVSSAPAAFTQVAADIGVTLDPNSTVTQAMEKMREADPNVEEKLNAAGISGIRMSTGDELVIWDQALLDTAQIFDITEGGRVRVLSQSQTPDRFVPSAYTEEQIRATDAFLDLAQEEGVQSLFTSDEIEAGAAYTEALEMILSGNITREFEQRLLAELQPTTGTTLFQSAAPLQEQPLTIVGTGPGGRVLNRDIGKAFTDRHMAAYGRALDPENPADYAIMLDSLLADYAEQSRQPDSGDSWYTDDIAEAIRLTEYIYPELANSQFRDLFLTVTALLSPQQKPGPNWENAILALRSWKETGRVELLKPSGAKFGVNTKGLQLLQYLIDTKGLEGAMRWVQETHTGEEMAQIRRDSGLFVEKPRLGQYAPNELNLKSVTLGIYMFGPKVGDFMQNSVGIDQNAVTVDLWAARSYNRYIGRLLDTPDGDLVGDVRGAKERAHIKRLIRDAAAQVGIDPSAMQAALWYFEQRLYRGHGVKSDSQNFSGAAEAALKSRGLDDALRTPVSYQQDAGGDAGKSPAASPARPVATEGERPGRDIRARAVGRGELGAGQEGVPAAPLQPLPGAPKLNGEQFGPIPELVSAAEAYAEKAGIPYTRQPVYVPITPSRSERIAQAYEDAKHEPRNPDVRRAYRALITQTKAQYDTLIDAGYTFTFFDNDSDPYAGNPWNAMRDLRDNKTMAVYSTLAGYGTDQTFDPSEHMLLEDTGLTWKDQNGNDVKVLANDLFRAVHDAFGHGLEGAGFRARGEENAWQAHARLFTGEAVKALTTETRGQNSWLNYGPYGEKNRTASLEDTVFANQKMTILPSWVSTEGTAGRYGLPVNEDGTVTLTHFSETEGLTQLDPSYHGTGMAGDEGARKNIEGWVDRTYFGVSVGKEGGYVSEFPAGTPSYEARVPADSLYDYQQDPDGLMATVKDQAITQRRANGDHIYDLGKLNTLYEKAIADAGYEGYFNNAMQGLTVAKFTPTDVAVTGVAPLAQQQAAGQQTARGGFTPSSQITDQEGNPVNLLQIFQKADPTTFLHESGHFWLEQLKADALAVGGQFQRDWDIVISWWQQRALNVKEEAILRAQKAGDEKAVVALQKMTERQVSNYIKKGDLLGSGTNRYLSVAMHEQFARGVENYFATGRAPSLSLSGLFNAFKAWVLGVYTRLLSSGLDVQFSPEVTAVLDRMLAADEEIAAIEGQYELSSLFGTAAEAGMTPSQFAAHQQKIIQAKQQSRAEHLSKAVAEARRARTQWWNEEREGLREAVEQQIAEMPAYRLLYALTQGGLANGSTLDDLERINPIDREALQELLQEQGFSLGDMPKLGSRPIHMKSKEEGDTTMPGAAAAAFGYDDVDSMILDLVGLAPYKNAVEAKLDAEMISRYGSMETAGEKEALASVYNDRTGQVMAAELEALRTTEPAFKIAFIRAYAAERMGEMTAGSIRPYQFILAEKRSAKAAGVALKKGDRATAYKHQFQRLVNHELARMALAAEKDVAKKTADMRRLADPKKKFPGIEAAYVDSIRSMVSLAQARGQTLTPDQQQSAVAQLIAFVSEKAAEGSIVDIPAWMSDAANWTSVSKMPYNRFLELHATIRRYEKQGRNAKKLRVGQQDADRQATIAVLAAKLSGRAPARTTRLREKTVSAGGSALSSAAASVAAVDAQLLRVEFLLELIDGEPLGPWHQALFQPFADAEGRKQELTREVSQLIDNLIKSLPPEVRKSFGKQVDVGSLGISGQTWTRGDLIMLALNIGNEGNLDKVIRGFGGDPDTNVPGLGWNISEDLINTALEQLTKEEWDLIQSIWGHAEKLWPEVERIYRDINGVSPDRVVPRTVKTKFGDITGGYFPIMYDTTTPGAARSRLEQMTALEIMQADVGRASVNSSMTKGRTGFAAPINLNIANLSRGFDNTIHFITHYEPVQNAKKILSDRELRADLERYVGISYAKELDNWVAALASNGVDRAAKLEMETLSEAVFRNTTMAVLGFSYSTLAMQALGLLNGFDRIAADTSYGPVNSAVVTAQLLRALSKSMTREHYQFVTSLSSEMRGRIDNFDRDIRMSLNSLRGKQGVYKRGLEVGMRAIGAAQFFSVDMPVWTVAFNRALAADPSDVPAAVAYADRVIRMSQSAGGIKDLAAVQRHRGVWRATTMFYSFFSVLYGALRQLGVNFSDSVRRNPASAVARAATRLFTLLIIQSVAQGLLKGELPDYEPEDEKAEDMMDYILKESLITAAGTIPILRDMVSGGLGGHGYKGGPGGIFGSAVAKAMEKTAKMLDEDGDEVSKDPTYSDTVNKLKPFVLIGGTLTGLPAVQVNRTLDGLAAMYDEEAEWSWTDLIRGYDEKRAKRRAE